MTILLWLGNNQPPRWFEYVDIVGHTYKYLTNRSVVVSELAHQLCRLATPAHGRNAHHMHRDCGNRRMFGVLGFCLRLPHFPPPSECLNCV